MGKRQDGVKSREKQQTWEGSKGFEQVNKKEPEYPGFTSGEAPEEVSLGRRWGHGKAFHRQEGVGNSRWPGLEGTSGSVPGPCKGGSLTRLSNRLLLTLLCHI